MIRGKFLMSGDDLTPVLAIRAAVFGEGRAEPQDAMAIYALVFDEDGAPAGAGRLCIEDDRFMLGRVGVLENKRGQGLGDLILRMLLFRAQEMSAPAVYVRAQPAAVSFYARYGLTPVEDLRDIAGARTRLLCATADQIDIEGSCHKTVAPCADCAGDCAHCAAAPKA